ncbi:31223_t:CDS:2, partial [Racocetra persica]
KGERLLYTSKDGYGQYNLMDPYKLKTPKSASKPFKKDETQIQEPYIIRSDKISDKIIYTIDGKVFIENLVPDNSGDWKEYEGELLKWRLEEDDGSVKLTVIDYNLRKKQWNPDDKKKSLVILPSFYQNGKNFILHCEVLENDDLITITRIGVIVWSYKFLEIKMHYYWNYWNGRLEDYETIFINHGVKFGKEGIQLFKTFLKDIFDEFYLTCYGKILMKTFIKLKFDELVQVLGNYCMDMFIQDDNHLISKISLLSIIFENFNELSENHPAFISSALSQIEFVVPSNYIFPYSMSSHLSSYGRYFHLSKTSFLDILTSNLWIRFQENFQTNHSSTILAIPLPGFVSYPKDYKFWQELLLPIPNPFTLAKRAFSFLAIMGFIIFAFAHSFYLLLRYSTIQNDPLNSVTTYNTTDPNNAIEGNSLLTETHTETKNMFMIMGSAISAVYLILTAKLCNLITDIQNDKWSGYTYISKNLKKVLLPDEEPTPTLAQIKYELKNELKKSEIDICIRIDNAIGELKKKINNMSNLK